MVREIRIKVTAGARKEVIHERGDDQLLLQVKQKAERGEANRRVREIVSARYGVPVVKVRILKGIRSPNKIITIM